MKSLPAILIGLLLAGCAGMDTSGGAGRSGVGASNQSMNDMHRYADPSYIYFGG
jgi:hypothetical protein